MFRFWRTTAVAPDLVDSLLPFRLRNAVGTLFGFFRFPLSRKSRQKHIFINVITFTCYRTSELFGSDHGPEMIIDVLIKSLTEPFGLSDVLFLSLLFRAQYDPSQFIWGFGSSLFL